MITPVPLEELKRMRSPIRNSAKIHQEKLTMLEGLALWITQHIGGVGFFIIVVCWTVFWFSWNTFAPVALRFDPFPAFELWLFISNVIQITLMPLIMIGQNLQNRHSEIRAEQEFQMNLREERELEAILQHLENHDLVLNDLLDSVKK